MRRFQVFLLALTCLAPGAAYAQGIQPRFDSMAAVHTVADKAWGPFFEAFRNAVRKRDRQTLKGMMSSPTFTYYVGGRQPEETADQRDQAFNYWDRPTVRGWEAFDIALSGGAAQTFDMWFSSGDSIFTDEGPMYVPTRVAPAGALAETNLPGVEIRWLASFEFHQDGHWYCWMFTEW